MSPKKKVKRENGEEPQNAEVGETSPEKAEVGETSPAAEPEKVTTTGTTEEAEAADNAEAVQQEAEDLKEDDGEEADAAMDDEEQSSPVAKTEPKGKEKPKELEADFEPDDRERVSGVALSEYDSTLDVFFSSGNIVSSLSQGGFQHLLSGVRCNTGVKSGRYFFEVKVLEKKTTDSESALPTLRLGVSLAKSSVFVGDGTTDNAGFDMDGTYFAPTLEDPHKQQTKTLPRKIQFQVIGILLNLDSGSPNANTISVFCDGARLSEPMKLPEHFEGKAVYPTITFKNYTLAVNLGSDGTVMKKLPFTCRMIGNAALADTETASFPCLAPGEKCNVVVPVGLPDEGFFDYIDRFLERHPEYVELSDRTILEWCRASGLKTWKNSAPDSRDRPAFHFGIPSIDNKGLRQSLRSLTQLVKRHYLVAELKGSMLSKEREDLLARFAAPHFSVTAHIAVGEPGKDHKDWVHQQITSTHEQKKADAIAAKKRAEEKKQRVADMKADRSKAKAAKTGKDDEAEEKAGDEEPPSKKQKVDEDDAEAKEEEDKEEPAPEIGSHVWFLPQGKKSEDMKRKDISANYASFTLPSESEGFAKVEHVWASNEASSEHLQKWINEKKATLIIDGLKPGEWFIEKQKAWEAIVKEMKQRKHRPVKAKTVAKKEAPKKDDDAVKDEAEENKEAVEEEKPDDPLHEGGEDGKPLYFEFEKEDWVLLAWRHELHLLAHAFCVDAPDIDFQGVPTEHVDHYYNLYFKRRYDPRSIGCASLTELVDLSDNSEGLKIETKGRTSYLVSLLEKDTEPVEFVRKVEESRQDRNRRMEAGDESASLKVHDRHDGERRPERKEKGGKGKGKGKKEGKGKKGKKDGQKGTWVRVEDLDKLETDKKGASAQEKKAFGFRERLQEKRATTGRFGASMRSGFKKRQEESVLGRAAKRPLLDAPKPWDRRRQKGSGKARGPRRFPEARFSQEVRPFDRTRPPPREEPRFRSKGDSKGGGPPRRYDAADSRLRRDSAPPPRQSRPAGRPTDHRDDRPTGGFVRGADRGTVGARDNKAPGRDSRAAGNQRPTYGTASRGDDRRPTSAFPSSSKGGGKGGFRDGGRDRGISSQSDRRGGRDYRGRRF